MTLGVSLAPELEKAPALELAGTAIASHFLLGFLYGVKLAAS